jgi:two-component system, response regulator YesN
MVFSKYFRNTNYRFGIVASLLILSLGILSVSTFINIFLAKKTISSEIISHSLKNIETNSSRLELFTDQIFSLSLEIDSDPNVVSFFHNSEVDYYLEYLVLTRLRKISAINPFVESIQLYNKKSMRIVDTKNDCSFIESYSDRGLITLLSKPQQKEILFLPRKGIADNVNLLSLIYYSGNYNDNHMKYAVIINIDEEIFHQNISIDESPYSQQYLLNEEGIVISHTDKKALLADYSQKEELHSVFQNPEKSGMKSTRLEDSRELLFFQKIPAFSWLFIYSTDMTQLLAESTRVQNIMLIISFILFILAIIFSLFSSKKLYTPINSLLEKIRPDDLEDSHLNELELISISFDKISKTKESLLMQNKEKLSLLQRNLLRRIFLTGMNQNELETELTRFELNHIHNNRLILAYIPPGIVPSDVSRFFIEKTSCIILLINKETLAIWILESESDSIIKGHITESLGHYPSLTFSMSNLVQKSSEIQHAYHQAAYYLKYKIILDNERLIDVSSVKDFEDKPYLNPKEIEMDIINALKTGQKDSFSESISKMIEKCRSISYSNIEKIILQIGGSCINEIKLLYHTEDRDFNLSTTFSSLHKINEITEWFLEFYELYHSYLSEQMLLSSASTVNKRKITETINYIQQNYQDHNLSLTLLSDQAKLSPNYFNTLFKQVTGNTLPNYINQCRFEAAKRFLIETDDKISHVAHITGFANLNYFYYKFKKNMGMTPLEYRILYNKSV